MNKMFLLGVRSSVGKKMETNDKHICAKASLKPPERGLGFVRRGGGQGD